MFQILYYTKDNENPILEFLKTLPKKDTAKILREIVLLEEFGLSLGMPHIKKLVDSDGLWELRIKYSPIAIVSFISLLKIVVFLCYTHSKRKLTKYPNVKLKLLYLEKLIT